MIYKKYDDNTYNELGIVIRFDYKSNLFKLIRTFDDHPFEQRYKTEQLAQNWIDWYIDIVSKYTTLYNK